MKKIGIISLLVLFVSCVAAQTNLKEGYIVLQKGDTLRGEIDYRNWEVNPLKIRFKSSTSENVYSPKDLLSFEIAGQDRYISAIVSKDMRPVDIAGLSKIGDEDILVTDTVFLRVLVSGSKVTLFGLVDHKVHFYIQENPNTQPEELIYKKYLSENNMQLQERAHFRNQLNRLAANNLTSGLPDKIEKCTYTEKDLGTVMRVINGQDINSAKTAEKKKKDPVQIMIGGGIQYYSFSFEGDNEQYTPFQFKNKVGPIASIAIDFFAGRNNQKLAVRLALSYSQYKLDGAYEATTVLLNRKQQFTYQITQNNITPQLGVLYHFVNHQNFRMYAGGLMALSLSSYPTNVYNVYTPETGKNETVYNPLEFSKSWIHVDIMLGARLYDKVNLGLSTKVVGSFVDYSSMAGKLFPVAFTASYIFINRKNKDH